MAQTIHPWIAAHLISIAEQHGTSTLSITRYKRRKIVQLTEVIILLSMSISALNARYIQWLTFADPNDNDSLLWATISDTQHTIPIRFSRVAIAEYNRYLRL
jgi:hypothetical protein